MADVNKIFVEKLNNQNYETWRIRVQMLLIKEDLWEFLESDCPNPVKNNTDEITNQLEINLWRRKDQKAIATIILLIDDTQLQLVRHCGSSKEVWKNLKDFHQKGTLSNKVSLLKLICRSRLDENESMEDHLYRLDDLFQRFANIGGNIEESFRVAFVLSSLPESYNTLTTALEARNENELTLSLVKSKLLDESLKRKQTLPAHDSFAMKVSRLSVNQIPISEVICYYCKNKGHYKVDCPRLKEKLQKEERSLSSNGDNNGEDDSKTHRTLLCF